MPTPSIQTLTTDAQQVLNLDSISSVRSVVAVALANANTGTPLNPNLTTQQLWDQFYQVVTRPKSDIESIIANQLMKFLYSPPAPGGAGADKQVIFNDGGVLAGDADFLWNKTTNLLTVTGSATISGDLTVDTSTLKVDSANNFVGVGTTTFVADSNVPFQITTSGGTNSKYIGINRNNAYGVIVGWDGTYDGGEMRVVGAYPLKFGTNNTQRYEISSTGVATWSNVGGVAGTAMTLNSTGLGVGGSPSSRLDVANSGAPVVFSMTLTGAQRWQQIIDTSVGNWTLRDQTGSKDVLIATAGTGNIGIGVTPSAWVAGAKMIDLGAGSAVGNAGSTTTTWFSSNSYQNGTNWIYKNSAAASYYAQLVGQHQWWNAPSGTAGNAITFTQAMTLDASGRLLVGPTSANTSGGVLQLSSGITFPATQVASSDANTLDDYEEGTWTIVVNNQLGNSATIASQIARYVKIGRRVFVFGDFTLSAKGAAAAGNLVYLGNLPFVPNSTLFEGSVVHKYDNVNLTTNGQINIISAAGGNNVCFFPISSATTGTSNLTFGQITDTTRLVFNFSYDV